MEKQEEIWQAVGRITINIFERDKMIGLFELLQKVEKNSGMYLGRQSVSDLFMFIAGYEFARSQINEELTQAEEDFYNEFQP